MSDRFEIKKAWKKVSNFGSDGFIIVGSLENEQSFAGNEVLLKSIFKGAFFSGKNRKLIFENMYLYGLPAELPETGVWGEIAKLRKNFL